MSNAILIPTDFSAKARQALRFAAENFGGSPFRFILLNAYANLPRTSAPIISLTDILKKRSEEGLQREVEFLSRTLGLPDLEVTRVSSAESLSEAIKDIVAREKVKMIVMGFSREDIDHHALTGLVNTPLLLVPS